MSHGAKDQADPLYIRERASERTVSIRLRRKEATSEFPEKSQPFQVTSLRKREMKGGGRRIGGKDRGFIHLQRKKGKSSRRIPHEKKLSRAALFALWSTSQLSRHKGPYRKRKKGRKLYSFYQQGEVRKKTLIPVHLVHKNMK